MQSDMLTSYSFRGRPSIVVKFASILVIFLTFQPSNPHRHGFYRGLCEYSTTPYPSAKMTGIQVPHTQDAVGEEDELQFHLELVETPPPPSTVATFDTYLFNQHYDLESSQPARGHGLGELQGSAHEPEPCSPNSPHFIWDNFDKIPTRPRAMAAQAMEALNRTFIELKSKNEETRLRASYELRDLVVSAARCKTFC